MENKNKVIIAGVTAMALAIGLLISKGQSAPEQITPEITKIDLSDKSDSHQAFVRPRNNQVKEQQLITKKLVQSKISKFQNRARSNSTTLVPTKAHEFHNPESKGLTGKKKVKATTVKAKKNKQLTEAEKKTAAELAKSQAFMKEQCGDIKDNAEKAECHQEVAFYLAQQKKNKALAKAQKEQEDKLSNNYEAPTQTNSDEDIELEDKDEETAQNVVTTSVNNNTTDTTAPDKDDEDNTPKTLSEWREFMVSTDEEGGDLYAKAPVLLAATNKSGKEGLSVNDFYTLMKEYYLQSGNAELEVLGVQTLNGVKSLLSFRTVMTFLNQETIASAPDQIATIEANIRNTYQQESQLNNLNLFIGTFALPTVTDQDGETTITPWDKKDPLYLTLEYVRNYSNAKFAGLTSTTKETVEASTLALKNTLEGIQSELKVLIEEAQENSLAEVETSASNTENIVTALVERIQELAPEENTETTTDTQTPTTLTNFTQR